MSNKKKEKGDRAFNEKWVQKYSVTLESIRNWLQEDIDNSDFDNYLSELVDFAKNIQQQKTANSIKLFKEPLYSDIDLAGIEFSLKNLNKVIDDEPLWTKFTEKTSGYKKHVISVYNEARKKYIETYKIQKIQKEANSIISAIKSIVQNKTGATQPPEADFGKVIKQQKVEEAINKSVTKMVQPQEIERENILGYSIVVKIRQFSGAKEFKNDAKITEAVKDDVFGAYESNDYVTFLRNLRTKQSFRIGNLHQYFVHTCIQLLTPENIPASGGQSTAFALILRLEEAKNKEIILIDEPEASLDNAFIKEELIQKIQDLKNNSTVFVITHNSTLGALINPDYLIVAKYDKNKEYQILSGEFDSKRITDKDGNTMNSYNDFVEAMEAGFTTYEEKGSQYESLR
ncbi:AAA family ATPase [Fructobacillus tropaeoli]|uniref:ATPase AAA-type core domain-containing protein n=1 Tax=Fructobacillus tropaeoli TaxID=709323 RepID=A0A3F3HGE4_9LACO|nr:AAA family ATPase [Fructobacillus tropaeoli]GAP04463.1 hypothetical protein FTRO_0050160 [Fructobacillus tropaeoli]